MSQQRRQENEYEMYTGTFGNSNYVDDPTASRQIRIVGAETQLQRRIYIFGILLIVALILAFSSLIYATVTVPQLLDKLKAAEKHNEEVRGDVGIGHGAIAASM